MGTLPQHGRTSSKGSSRGGCPGGLRRLLACKMLFVMLVWRRGGLQGLGLRGGFGFGCLGLLGCEGVGDSEVFGFPSTGLQD